MDGYVGLRWPFLLSITLMLLITIREILVSKLHENRGKPQRLLYTYIISLILLYTYTTTFFGLLLLPILGLLVILIVLTVKYEQAMKQTYITRLSDAIKAVDETESLTLLEVLIDYPRFLAKLFKRHGVKKAAMVVAAITGMVGVLWIRLFFLFSRFPRMRIWYAGFLALIGIVVGWKYHDLTKKFTKASLRLSPGSFHPRLYSRGEEANESEEKPERVDNNK